MKLNINDGWKYIFGLVHLEMHKDVRDCGSALMQIDADAYVQNMNE